MYVVRFENLKIANVQNTGENVQKRTKKEKMMKKTCCLSLDKDVRHKLLIIYTIKKRFFDKDTTISGIVDQALIEYFDNHKEEIDKMMDDYHALGGCFEL